MNDKNSTIETVKDEMRAFIKERKWEKFHNAKNVSMSIAIEAAELMEIFQWLDTNEIEDMKKNPEKMQDVQDEVADIFCYLLSFANSMDIDLTEAVFTKMVKNRKKYPQEAFQGNYEKQFL